MSGRLGFVCLLFAVVAGAAPPEFKVQPAAISPRLIVKVSCASGQSVQAAVDANRGPVDIYITGMCVENVLIRDKDVSLHGTKPSLDGIRGTSSATPALTVMGSVLGSIDNLSFSNNAGLAVSIRGTNVTLSNCLFENNAGTGLQVNAGGFVTADGLTFNANTGPSIFVSDAQFFCTGCDVSGNNFAVLANRGAIVSLLDSMVTGRRGIAAVDAGTLADIDCVSVDTLHACGVQVTGVAAQAFGGGTASLYGAGDFTGQVDAEDRGTVQLLGARQINGAQPGQGPAVNVVDFFGIIEASAFLDFGPPLQSLLRDTVVLHFSRVLVTNDTILKGSIQCSSAGDAWLDPTIIALPGSTATGCDHATLGTP
jgi:hypothetical protein